MYIGPKVYSIWAHGPLGFRVRGGEAVKLVSAVMFSCGVGPSSSKENSLRHSQACHRERRFVDPAMRPLAQGRSSHLPMCETAPEGEEDEDAQPQQRRRRTAGVGSSAELASTLPFPFTGARTRWSRAM